MKKLKLKLFALTLIIIVLMLVCQVRLVDSSFSPASNGTATSVVTSGNIELDVREITALEDGVTIVPGESISWQVEAKNVGDHPFYLRVKLAITTASAYYVAQDCLLPQFDETLWEYHDGWYYYKNAVAPDNTPIRLFDFVEVNGDVVDNSYMNKQIDATVVAHAVQSDNNPLTDGKTFTAAGWPKE